MWKNVVSFGWRLAYSVVALALAWIAFVVALPYFQSDFLYGSFEYGGHTLAVLVTVSAENYGLFDIRNGKTDTSIILEPQEWDTLVALWYAAKSERSENWRQVGEIVETDTFDSTRLSLLSGPGVRFVLHENGACADYVLPAADAKRFEQAIQTVQKRLHGGAAQSGIEIRPRTLSDKLRVSFDSALSGPRSHPVPSPSNCR